MSTLALPFATAATSAAVAIPGPSAVAMAALFLLAGTAIGLRSRFDGIAHRKTNPSSPGGP